MLSQAQLVAIDYLSQPDADQISQEEFCAIMAELGFPIVTRTLRRWKELPEFAAMLSEAKGQADASDDLLARRSRRWAIIQYMAFYREKKNPASSRLAALKHITDLTNDYISSTTVELDSATDETLLRMALARDITVEGLTKAQMKAMLGGLDGDSEPSSRSGPAGKRDSDGLDSEGQERGGTKRGRTAPA